MAPDHRAPVVPSLPHLTTPEHASGAMSGSPKPCPPGARNGSALVSDPNEAAR